jgi:hypothetical protein
MADDEQVSDPLDPDLLRRLGAEGLARNLEGMRNPLVQALAKGLGVDLTDAEAHASDYFSSVVSLGKAIRHLGGLGWVATDRQLPAEVYVEAVRLIESGAARVEIDKHMTTAWNDGSWLARSFAPMFTLHDKSDAQIEQMLARQKLLHGAIQHHQRGEYAASILIVLTQIDGLAFDFLDESGRLGVFGGGTGAEAFVDEVTVAGMSDNLRAAWRAFIRTRHTTALTGALERSPILHGRELAYATRVNSTKVFAFLSGFIEFLQAVEGRVNSKPRLRRANP